MKIVLKKGKQKELIIKAKGSSTWKELGKKLKISPEYLQNDLKNERIFILDNLYNQLCNICGENYNKFIINKLGDNWGRTLGGKNSKGNTKKISLPKDSKELAEFYGIMLGDGNLTIKKAYKIGTYQIRIVGDSRYDKEYLVNFVKPLIERLFNVKARVLKHKNENALYIVATGLELAHFLESKGFKAGNKIINQLEIPPWIKSNKEHLKSCLRGLYDTDGSIYKITNQNSYQICFTNYNNKLLNDVRNSLLSLGINVSKITKGRDIVITKKSELRSFLNQVGFHNFKHLDKAKMWNLAL